MGDCLQTLGCGKKFFRAHQSSNSRLKKLILIQGLLDNLGFVVVHLPFVLDFIFIAGNRQSRPVMYYY